MATINDLNDALKDVGLPYFYGLADKDTPLPYISYTELYDVGFNSDEMVNSTATVFQISLFTDVPLDHRKWKIHSALNNKSIPFSVGVSFQDNENCWQYAFEVTLECDADDIKF